MPRSPPSSPIEHVRDIVTENVQLPCEIQIRIQALEGDEEEPWKAMCWHANLKM